MAAVSSDSSSCLPEENRPAPGAGLPWRENQRGVHYLGRYCAYAERFETGWGRDYRGRYNRGAVYVTVYDRPLAERCRHDMLNFVLGSGMHAMTHVVDGKAMVCERGRRKWAILWQHSPTVVVRLWVAEQNRGMERALKEDEPFLRAALEWLPPIWPTPDFKVDRQAWATEEAADILRRLALLKELEPDEWIVDGLGYRRNDFVTELGFLEYWFDTPLRYPFKNRYSKAERLEIYQVLRDWWKPGSIRIRLGAPARGAFLRLQESH